MYESLKKCVQLVLAHVVGGKPVAEYKSAATKIQILNIAKFYAPFITS